ncbi:MAG: hypothetical protein M3347_04870 [Armatimonadota bacterium]|nr:hypothetical protein [Armatimonadota bacterium]
MKPQRRELTPRDTGRLRYRPAILCLTLLFALRVAPALAGPKEVGGGWNSFSQVFGLLPAATAVRAQ